MDDRARLARRDGCDAHSKPHCGPGARARRPAPLGARARGEAFGFEIDGRRGLRPARRGGRDHGPARLRVFRRRRRAAADPDRRKSSAGACGRPLMDQPARHDRLAGLSLSRARAGCPTPGCSTSASSAPCASRRATTRSGGAIRRAARLRAAAQALLGAAGRASRARRPRPDHRHRFLLPGARSRLPFLLELRATPSWSTIPAISTSTRSCEPAGRRPTPFR